jgi:hypothetical protein
MKKSLAVFAVTGLLFAVVAPAGAAGKKPVKLFEDVAGDADNTQGTGQSIPGGFDLVNGTIQKVGKDLEFVVTHADMPPIGSIGEAFRLIWGIGAGTEQYEMTIKSLDIGKPDAVATAMGQAPNGAERVGTVYQGVARLEQCGTISLGISWSQCTAVAYYDAVFDPAAMTVTWKVALSDLKAKPGTIITGGTGGRATTGCQICWVAQYAERSLTSASPPHTIIDAATQTVMYKVPR